MYETRGVFTGGSPARSAQPCVAHRIADNNTIAGPRANNPLGLGWRTWCRGFLCSAMLGSLLTRGDGNFSEIFMTLITWFLVFYTCRRSLFWYDRGMYACVSVFC